MKKHGSIGAIYLTVFYLLPINLGMAQTASTEIDSASITASMGSTAPESVSQTSHLAIASIATPGADMVVAWSGPGKSDDAIYVYEPGQTKTLSKVKASADDFKPAIVKAPLQAGVYELQLKSGGHVLATAEFSVVAGQAMIQVLTPIVIAGELVTIEWNGPRNSGDRLSIALIGSPSSVSQRHASGSTANLVSLKAPSQAGKYEVRLQDRSNAILAKHQFEVR